MGVDYSITMGYGIAIPRDETPDVFKDFEVYEDGGIPEWLDDNGFDAIEYTYAGDWMNGDCYLFFYDKQRYFHEYSHDLDTLYDFNTQPSDRAWGQLTSLAAEFARGIDTIGWKLISNVS